MKIAVSMPDELFEQGERVASRLGVTRSKLYRDALAAYLGRFDVDVVTSSWDSALADGAGDLEPDIRASTLRTLAAVEW